MMKKLLLILLPIAPLKAKPTKKQSIKKTSNIFEKLDIIVPCVMLGGLTGMICYNEYVDKSKEDEERINSLSTLDPLHVTPVSPLIEQKNENIDNEETQEYVEIKSQINKVVQEVQNIDNNFKYEFKNKKLEELRNDLYEIVKIKVQKQQDNSPISPLIEQNNEKIDDLLHQSTIIHNSVNESILNTPESIATPTLNEMMVNRPSYSDDKNIGSLPKTPNLVPSKTSNDNITSLDLNYNNSNKESPLATVDDDLEGNYKAKKEIFISSELSDLTNFFFKKDYKKHKIRLTPVPLVKDEKVEVKKSPKTEKNINFYISKENKQYTKNIIKITSLKKRQKHTYISIIQWGNIKNQFTKI